MRKISPARVRGPGAMELTMATTCLLSTLGLALITNLPWPSPTTPVIAGVKIAAAPNTYTCTDTDGGIREFQNGVVEIRDQNNYLQTALSDYCNWDLANNNRFAPSLTETSCAVTTATDTPNLLVTSVFRCDCDGSACISTSTLLATDNGATPSSTPSPTTTPTTATTTLTFRSLYFVTSSGTITTGTKREISKFSLTASQTASLGTIKILATVQDGSLLNPVLVGNGVTITGRALLLAKSTVRVKRYQITFSNVEYTLLPEYSHAFSVRVDLARRARTQGGRLEITYPADAFTWTRSVGQGPLKTTKGTPVILQPLSF